MLLAFFVFLIGASLASFLTVWAERGSFMKASKGRSSCGNCTLTIFGHHLVPVFSWLALRGKCRRCKVKIPFFYIIFEASLGFAFVLLFGKYFGFDLGVVSASGETWIYFVRDLFFLLVFSLLFVYDYFWQLLPDKITIPAVVIAFVANVFLGFGYQDMIIGGAIVGGFFFVQYAISRGTWVGGGDIRFGVLLGFLLGTVDGVLSLFIAYIIGASVAIIMLMSGVATRKSALPMGTFLAIAGFIVLMWGPQISKIFFL